MALTKMGIAATHNQTREKARRQIAGILPACRQDAGAPEVTILWDRRHHAGTPAADRRSS
jgi:hypothetical protein